MISHLYYNTTVTAAAAELWCDWQDVEVTYLGRSVHVTQQEVHEVSGKFGVTSCSNHIHSQVERVRVLWAVIRDIEKMIESLHTDRQTYKHIDTDR